MSYDNGVDFEGFLIEDVILTLGNVRLTLSWLATDGQGSPGQSDGAWRQAGVDRLDRQLSQLEDRARALRDAHRLRRAPGDVVGAPVFRSRRVDGVARGVAGRGLSSG